MEQRVIKFRAWDTEKKQWLGVDDIPDVMKWTLEGNQYVIGRFVLQQFTGLLDKDGKEIYEGDILESTVRIGNSTIRSFVFWHSDLAMWKVEEINPKYNEREYLSEVAGSKHPDRSKIIGNIYENPSLLRLGEWD